MPLLVISFSVPVRPQGPGLPWAARQPHASEHILCQPVFALRSTDGGLLPPPTAPAEILRILPLLELRFMLEQVLPGYLGTRPVSRTCGRVASGRYVAEKTRGRPEHPGCPARGRLRGGHCGSRRGLSRGPQRFFLLCGRSHLSFTAQKAKSPG